MWFAGAGLAPLANAAGLTSSQVQSILALLQSFGADQATINNVNAALTGQAVTTPTTTGGSTAVASYTFTRDLTVGSRGADVKALQEFLNAKGYTVAQSGAGSVGNETEYFGPATKAALAKFQAANNISPAVGYFGPITMKAVNAMEGTVTTTGGSTTGTVVSGVVSVALASNSPAAGTIVAGQAVANLGAFTFSNGSASPVTVTSLTVTRTGVSSDNTLTNVYLYVGNNRVTDGTSLVNSQATFTNSNGLFTVPANSTVTANVKADIESGISGQSVGVAVMSASDIVASGAAFTGTFPVQSALQNVANVTDLAGVTMSQTPTGAGTSINAGTMNAIVWSEPVSVSQRTVYLKYVRFRQIGSVQSDALQNFGLYLDGSQIGTASMNSDGTVIFDMTSNPVSLNTGSHTLELHADIVKGSSRTFSFSVQTASDMVLTDSNYGVNITPNAAFPLATSQTTVQSGTLSVTTDPNFTTNQTLSTASNVTLGQFSAKAYGENMRVGSLKVQVALTGTTATSNYINNIAVYVNGAQVGSSQNWAVGSSTNPSTTLTFGSGNLFTLNAGDSAVIAVKGDTSLATTTTAIQVSLIEPANSLQGLSSYTTSPSSETTVSTGQTLSLTSGSLTISSNSAYGNQTFASNVAKQKIASYVLQASNVDSVQVTQITVNLGGTLGLTNLSNLYVSDNQTPVYPQSQNTFPVNFTIAPGQTHTVDVYADIGNATGTVTSSIAVSARAVTSNAQVGNTVAVNGQTITVGNGTLGTPTFVSSVSPTAQYVQGSLQNTDVATYNFLATNGPVNVNELKFTVDSASTTITQVAVGSVTAPVVNGVADLTGLSIAVPNDYAGTNVAVKGSYISVGPNGIPSGVTSTMRLTYVKYVSGGSTLELTPNATSTTMMLVAAYPTISASNTTNSGLGTGEQHLYDMTVAANGGTIAVGTTTFTVSASGITGGTLTSPRLAIGNTTVSGSSCSASTSSLASAVTVTCTLPANYNISGGSSVTFSLYGTVGGTLGSAGQSSITTALGAANTFSWTDVSGNGGPYTTANTTYLNNYPTQTWSIHN